MEKFAMSLKDNDFINEGFCYKCLIEGNKVTINDELSRFDESFVIQIEQFEQEFIEMSETDYHTYVNASKNGEDEIFEAVSNKYKHLI